MDCRTFKKSLENYLQDGLDFRARFGMERHAQQCIFCGKEMADALRLRQIARELEQVKAPLGFESAVLSQIAKRCSHARIPFFGRFWVYGIERQFFRNSALAVLSVAMIGIGALYFYRQSAPPGTPVPSLIAAKPAIADSEDNPSANSQPIQPMMLKPVKAEKTPEMTVSTKYRELVPDLIQAEMESLEVDYVEHIMPGPNDRPVTVRLPKAIRVRFGQTSEEYFIRNVSH